MATYVLRPGDMAGWNIPGVIYPATVVGANPVLADDDDSTYIEVRGDAAATSQWAIGPLGGTVDGTITDITVDLRIHDVYPTVDASNFSFTVQLWDSSESVAAEFTQQFDRFGGAIDASSPTWFTGIPLTAGSLDGMDLSAGGQVYAFAPTNTAYVGTAHGRLMEVVFHITAVVTASRPSPLRRYPPVGNGGFGPTRHWPRSVNRRAGGTY